MSNTTDRQALAQRVQANPDIAWHLLAACKAALPSLIAELFAAAEKRLNTPTSQCVGPVLGPVTMTEADCEEADMAIHRWKLNGGPVRDHEARALRLQMNDKSGRFE